MKPKIFVVCLSALLLGSLALVCLSALLLGSLALRPPAVGLVYVSPNGDDRNSGSIHAPLATLAGARDKVREIKARSDKGITVYFRGGQYNMTDTVFFDEEDSGTEDMPVTYTAYPGETPVFTGGVSLSGSLLTKVSGELAARIPARDRVYALNLLENGFSGDDLDYGLDNWEAHGGLTFAVYLDDVALYPARYPNKVPGLFPENQYSSYIYIEDGGAWAGEQTGVDHPAFSIPAELAGRVASWSLDEVWLGGMLSYTWFHEKNPLHGFDPLERTVTLDNNMSLDWNRAPNFGKYYFENVLEELDSPGEYYVDKATGTLLVYPPDGVAMAGAVLKIPKMSAEFFIKTQQASWLTFSNLKFELSRGSGLNVWGGSHVTVDGCNIENISRHGIYIDGYVYEGYVLAEYWAKHGEFPPDEPSAAYNGLYHTVKNCVIQNIGGSGARIVAGRTSTREPGHFLFENNTVLHTGLLDNWGGVSADGVGIRLLRNTVRFAPGFGMGLNGPDSVAAYNELCDVVCDPGQNDSSAFGIHHGGIGWGLRIHDNYIHDIPSTPVRQWETFWEGPTPNRLALYVDGSAPGTEITRNVVYNAPVGMSMPDNPIFPSVYANNIFIDNMIPLQPYLLSNLGYMSHLKRDEALAWYEHQYTGGVFTSGLYKTAWRDVYPEFYNFFEYYLHDKKDLTQPMSQVYNNTIVNITVPLTQTDPHGANGILPPDVQVTPDPVYGRYGNNRYLGYDPGFADYRGDLQLSKETCESLGIEWIDLSQIGARLMK